MELTGIWPPLPTIIRNWPSFPIPEDYDFDAAVVHQNHVCEVNLSYLTKSQLQRLASAMQVQLPRLNHLLLGSFDDGHPAPALPDGFLGGSAPRLLSLKLNSVGFPALPKLLLSATDLVHLTLENISHSGYVSPEAIVTGLAVLASLQSLIIEFRSPLSLSNSDSRPQPSPIRTILPALTCFEFKGVSEYLEHFLARIDAPSLDLISITFFHQLIFDIPQLAQFMKRTTRFGALNEAHVDFGPSCVQVGYLPPQIFDGKSGSRILCGMLDWQLSSLAQVSTSFYPSISKVEHLYFYGDRYMLSQWQDDTENMQWLDIFHPFTGVKNLYVVKEISQPIAFILQELVGEDVLPALESLFLEDLRPRVKEAIVPFIATQQLLGHPVTVFDWERT